MAKFIRIKDVMEKTGIARTTVWLWVKEDRFPKPIKLSSKVTVWNADEIDIWMNNFLD